MRRIILFLIVTLLFPTFIQAAESPDDLIADFITSFELRHFELYESLLDNDFVFLFSPEDAQTFGTALFREQELAIADAIFSGQTGGPSIPPVWNIQVELVPLGDWETRPGRETLFRSYDASLRVTFTDYSVLIVEGIQEFGALDVGEGSPDYTLIGWVELGSDVASKSAESASWGPFKMGSFTPVGTSATSVSRLKSTF